MVFISFEGPDGSGKTSALKALEEILSERGLDFIITREPGSYVSKEAQAIRSIILDTESDLSPTSEAILYSADRRIHLDQVIWPALKNGKIVLCDRYIDSSLAYQGYAKGLGIEKIKALNIVATDNFWPNLTFFFDVKPSVSFERTEKRNLKKDRLELLGESFTELVYEGYQEVIKLDPSRFVVIDASLPFEQVVSQILETLKSRFNI